MEVLVADKFTMTGVRAQSEAIAAYATTREAFERIAAPTLVLHGDEDTAVDVKYGRELAEVIPEAASSSSKAPAITIWSPPARPPPPRC